jgi:hypothetical protein
MARVEETGNVHRILSGKPLLKRPLGRPRRRKRRRRRSWEYSIKMNLKKTL